ncbi:MAG: hypothetical protein PF508_13775, partial [Spirochaeta sp.]|nr:hypothetical protein [Spirochaeta sp.]
DQVRDFHNIAALFSAGEVHIYHLREPLPWEAVPLTAMQIPAAHDDWCYRLACRGLDAAPP